MKHSYVGTALYGGDPGPVSQIGADCYLVHLPRDGDNHNAEVIRAANPNADIWGRFDNGEDNQQVDTSKPARDEAWRWFVYIKRRVEQSPPGTFNGVVGINEAWGTNLQWRADFEVKLCMLVQTTLGVHYAWGSIPVGNLEPEQLAIFAPVIQEAWAVNYHGYLKKGRTALSQETDRWTLWRPLDMWLPECRRMGLPFKRVLFGELGTYDCWLGQMTLAEYASLCIDVARELGRRCEAAGVEFLGGCGFGFGTSGTMAVWDMRGCEGTLAAAIADDHREVPTVSDYAKAIWTPVPSFGYPTGTPGRQGHLPVAICNHIAQGTEAGCLSEFGDVRNKKSSTYLVCKDGRVRQFVRESDVAWANGTWAQPTTGIAWIADAVAHNVNGNLLTISIEHEGMSGVAFPEPQYQATLALHRDILRRNGWPVDRTRIVGHYQIDSVTRANCPGSAFPWARLLADLQLQPPNVSELRAFLDWGMARLQAGQSFQGASGLTDFRAHLKALGCPDDPYRYGYPIKV